MTLHWNNRALFFCLLGMLCFACQANPSLQSFTAEAALSPTGSLVVAGACDAPDGAVVLVRALGAPGLGAQVEQAVLAEVNAGRYAADLNLYETLGYEITVSLSPQWSPHVTLPDRPPAFADPRLRVRENEDGWEVVRRLAFRIGTPEQETQLLQTHLHALTDACNSLELAEKQLRTLEQTRNRRELPRWLRLHLERKRPTPLGEAGIDPFFPTAHAQLRKYETLLLRRYHSILADLTGNADEAGKLSRNWTMVERHGKKAKERLNELSRLNPPR